MMLSLSQSVQLYVLNLEEKYRKAMENRISWVIVALVVLVGIGLYAWYCTSRGKSFAFNVKFHWPRSGEMGVACR